jgi:hypothetical protein
MHPSDTDDWRDRPLPPRPTAPTSPPLDPVLVDGGLRIILDRCPLAPADRADLRRRGLTDAQIDALPFGSLPADGPSRYAIAAAVVTELGPRAFGAVPGLYANDNGAARLAGYPGLLIGVEVASCLVGLTMRPHDPAIRGDGKYRWLSSAKRPGGVGSGAPCGVTFPVGWDPASPVRRVVVTEGILKGYVAAQKLGIPVITMPGATITAGVLPLVRQLGATDVVSAYDADRTTNPHVGQAESALIQELTGAGVTVHRATWPANYKGIDDALAAGVLPMLEPVTATTSDKTTDCGALVAKQRRKIATLERTVSTLVQTVTNRNLGDSGGAVLTLIAADLQKQAAERPTSDGYYNANPKHIANRWDGEGEERPSIIGESTIRRYAKKFGEAGILDIDYRPDTITKQAVDHRTGELVDKVIPITVPWIRYAGSLADQLDPATKFHDDSRPNRGGARPRTRVNVFPTTCPDCQGAVQAACRTCGAIVESVTVDLTDLERAMLEYAVPIDAEAEALSRDQVDRAAPQPASAAVDYSHALLDAPSNATEEEHRDDHSCGLVDRATASRRGPVTRTEARVDNERRKVAQDALAAADRAATRRDLHNATDQLAADLGAMARERGRHPVPKPGETAGDDAWTW